MAEDFAKKFHLKGKDSAMGPFLIPAGNLLPLGCKEHGKHWPGVSKVNCWIQIMQTLNVILGILDFILEPTEGRH